MNPRIPIRRWTARSMIVAAMMAPAVGLAVTGPAALAANVAASGTAAEGIQAAGSPVTANPYAPAYQHSYRHGAVPTLSATVNMRDWAAVHRVAAAAPAATAAPVNMTYHGGTGGIGVTTGQEKVYLVFYGSQWGTQGANSNGNVALSGDPSGEGPVLQQLFKGLGTGGELWSGVMTQYCDGVASGATSCPSSSTEHVSYPTGGALAGVWVDESAASPAQASTTQLGDEAVNAAAHFGNTTAAANRDAQYVIISPTGTHPDGYNTSSGQFCAWHSATWSSAASAYVAYTNLPYITDRGSSCGSNFINSGTAGTDDGVSVVEGHEYAETLTDQIPDGGWIDSSNGENGDKCAWIRPGNAGAVTNLVLPTGTFAMQSTWANDANSGAGGCESSHAIVTDPGTGGSELDAVGAGKCLDVPNGATGSGTQVQIWDCNGGSNQIWTHTSSNQLAVYGGSSQMCLDAANNQTTAGTKVQIWSCNGGANQTWQLNSNGTITGVQSGLCLDVSGASTSDGTLIQLWTCNGASNQQWTKG